MKQCEMCGKGSVVRRKRKLLRGHHNPVNKSRKQPNLQKVNVDEATRRRHGYSGQGKMRICTQCMRTVAKAAK